MRFGRGVGAAAVALTALMASACTEPSRPVVFVTTPDVVDDVPAALADFWANATAGQWRSLGDNRIEVWVCHVPEGATDPIYGGLPLRLPLTPDQVVATITEPVSAYFDSISHGQYRPEFVAGGEFTMAVDDAPQACIDAALDAAADETRVVLAVADAEHGADQVGGFAVGGDPCPAEPPC